MSRGYYKMERGWLCHELFSSEPFDRRSAWIWLIEEAAFAPRQKIVGGMVLTFERGQLCHSYRFMAKAWRWKKDRVSRFLKTLERARMIRAKTATVGATGEKLITICNYNKYQGDKDTGATANATETRQQRDKLEVIKRTITETEGFPSASGGVIDLGKQVYDLGKPLLEGNGISKSQSGRLITKWRKELGADAALLDIFAGASRAERHDIVAYIPDRPIRSER